ncbi:MAG: sugar ABC transporter ATP-binding protein [Nocardiopsaceae bacterium]|jgi:ABC-type sugar transport system ATPase subunit|nr:sugar ABC transporter ATP-binding protein [Nocardiopsaceae bacterium]
MSAVLEACAISKAFPGVQALDDVSLALLPGEVHALVGENGAGKSTLISILSGAEQPDAGHVAVNGSEVHLASPAVARKHGVATIFQELSIEPWLSVAANVVLGNEPGRIGMRALLSARRAETVAREALDRLGAHDVPVKAEAGRLTTGHKQLVEIARALTLDAAVIVMDEPTSSLPHRDAARLLQIIRQLRDQGRAILFVSHRLDEVKQIADRVTVLRGGRHVVTLPVGELSTSRMIEHMTGRRVGSLFPPRSDSVGEVVFRATGLTSAGAFEDVSFEVRRGEILGFSGLIGAGRTEVMRAIVGADPLDAGEIEFEGRRLSIRSPRDAIAAGISYLPEDRKDQGLVLQISARENMVMPTLKVFSPSGIIRGGRIRRTTTEMGRRIGVRGDLDRAAANLSGGNQQKVLIAKGLVSQAKLIIFDEPTRGVDVGAKFEIYELIQSLAAKGVPIILVSSELPEIMNVAHRAVVMSGGRVHGEFSAADFTESELLAAAFAAFRKREATGARHE